ncbi:MAG TPA: hypothetical protein VEA37_10665 [Flavobacterium sp.]|nr:hypothetical protein [Flavobacterium sp.]
MSELREVHWEFNKPLLQPNSPYDSEHFPRYEIFGSPIENKFKMLVRWTFRLFDLEHRQVLGFITESDLFIDYEERKDNPERVLMMLETTALNFGLAFDERIEPYPHPENLRIPSYQWKFETVQEIIEALKSKRKNFE